MPNHNTAGFCQRALRDATDDRLPSGGVVKSAFLPGIRRAPRECRANSLINFSQPRKKAEEVGLEPICPFLGTQFFYPVRKRRMQDSNLQGITPAGFRNQCITILPILHFLTGRAAPLNHSDTSPIIISHLLILLLFSILILF